MTKWMLTVMCEERWHGHVDVPDLRLAVEVIELLDDLLERPIHALLTPWSETWACTVCSETRRARPRHAHD